MPWPLPRFDNVSVNAVPLPAAGWLLMSALGGIGAWSRRRRARLLSSRKARCLIAGPRAPSDKSPDSKKSPGGSRERPGLRPRQ